MTTEPTATEPTIADGDSSQDDLAGNASAPLAATPDISDTADTADTAGTVPPVRSQGSRKAELEKEGEVAADFLETLMDIADLDGDLEVDVDGDRASVSIVDSDEGSVPRRLIGPQASVLEALQELTRLAVQAETGDRSRLMLDIGGHREGRRQELIGVASKAVDKVKADGERRPLDPMTAFERKVVHDEVLRSGLQSASEGEEPRRYVVVLPVS